VRRQCNACEKASCAVIRFRARASFWLAVASSAADSAISQKVRARSNSARMNPIFAASSVSLSRSYSSGAYNSTPRKLLAKSYYDSTSAGAFGTMHSPEAPQPNFSRTSSRCRTSTWAIFPATTSRISIPRLRLNRGTDDQGRRFLEASAVYRTMHRSYLHIGSGLRPPSLPITFSSLCIVIATSRRRSLDR